MDASEQADRAIDEAREDAQGPVVYVDEIVELYPRARAIESGELRDVTDLARPLGWAIPVAISRGAWNAITRDPRDHVRHVSAREITSRISRARARSIYQESVRARRGDAMLFSFEPHLDHGALAPWQHRLMLADKALRAGRERRRARVLLRSLIRAVRVKRCVPSEVERVVFADDGEDGYAVDFRGARSFGVRVLRGRPGLENVSMLAEVTSGDNGEAVLTITHEDA